MAELREAHLRYLLAIYELGKSTPDVGTHAVAKALNCSKASVTKMMATLMDMNLLVREKYGKIYLTDTGFLLAKDMLRCVELIHERLPAMGFNLTEEEARDFVRTRGRLSPCPSGRREREKGALSYTVSFPASWSLWRRS